MNDAELIAALTRKAQEETLPLAFRNLLTEAAGRLSDLVPDEPTEEGYGHGV